MQVDLVDYMGSDLAVVNSARVSFAKHHEEFTEGDEKLIKYLAAHGHWAPFAHPQISLRIKVPIFVARQLHKHQVGFIVSEESRRYIDTPPEFYITDKLGARAENKKQGAKDGEFITDILATPNTIEETLKHCYEVAEWTYIDLLDAGVAPEDARVVLPQATYTSWIWTGSLAAYARLYGLRSKPDSQRQTREVAEMISDIVGPLFPYSWQALCQN